MATLFNTKISATYPGLLKTLDNAALSATLRELTDGAGNQSGLFLNTAGDFKVTSVLEWGSLKDTGTGVTITQFVTAADGIENFNNDTTLPTSAAVKLYVDTKFSQTDTLTEVLGFGNTTSGKDIAVSAGDDITFTDTSKILMGAGSDLQIYHDGNNSYINDAGTGSLLIRGNNVVIGKYTGETLINAVADGRVDLYYDNSIKVTTTSTGAEVTGDLVVTGTITGSGGSFLPLAGGTMTGNIVLNDNVKTIYGAGSDLEIFHNGTNDFIVSKGTYNIFEANNHIFRNLASNEDYAKFIGNGAVELYYNGTKKFETTSTGVSVTGTITGDLTGDVTGDLTGTASKVDVNNSAANQDQFVLQGRGNLGSQIVYADAGLLFNPATNFLTVDGSGIFTGDLTVTGNITGGGGSFLPLAGGTMTGDTIHNDNVKSIYGTGSDLQIYHDAPNSYVETTSSSAGDFFIRSQGSGHDLYLQAADDVFIYAQGGADAIIAKGQGAVELYHNNVKKFQTSLYGADLFGSLNVLGGSVEIQDNQEFKAGGGLDLRIGHNATDSYIKNNTGGLFINQAAVTQSIIFKVSDANALDTTALTISRNGDLTTGRDVTIAGDLTVNGTTTTVNSQTLAVVDPLIQLAKDNTANSLDIGLYGDYNDGTDRFLGLFSDASDSNKFKLFKGTTVEPTTTVDIGGAGYVAADLQVAGLEISAGTSSGNFTFGDGNELRFGSSNEFGLFYSSGVSNIRVNSGQLDIRADDLKLCNQDKSENYLTGVNNGAVTLNYAGSTKLSTSSTGVSVTGQINADTGSILRGSEGLYFSAGGDTANGRELQFTSSANGGSAGAKHTINARSGNGMISLATSGTTALTIDQSQNATFAGSVTAESALFTGATETRGNIRTTNPSDNSYYSIFSNSGALTLDTYGVGGSINFKILGTTKFTIDSSGNSTFTGDITINDATGNGALTLSGGASSNETYQITQGVVGVSNGGLSITNIAESANAIVIADVSMNVGIGTDSPAAKLEIKGDGGGAGLTFKTTDSSSNETFFIQDGGAVGVRYSPFSIGIPNGTAVATNALFQVEEAGLLTVLTNGNVGIGTTSPDWALDVEAVSTSVQFQLGRTGTSVGSTWMGSDSNGFRLGVGTYGAGNNITDPNGFTVTTTGNVGIGTTSPVTKLEVDKNLQSDTINRANSAAYIRGQDIGLAIGQYATGPYGTWIQSISDQDATFPLTLNGLGGNVGIGTKSPDAVLETSTSATGNTVGALLTNTNGAGTADSVSLSFGLGRSADGYIRPVDAIKLLKEQQWTGTASTVDAALVFSTVSDETVSERMRITSAGNVKIGNSTTGTPALNADDLVIDKGATESGITIISTAAASIRFGDAANTSAGSIEYNHNSDYMRFSTNNAERMRITSGGQVGIGGIVPSQQLELGGIASPALKFTSTGTNGGVIIFNVAGADKGFIGSGYHLGTGSSNDTAIRGEGDLVFLSNGNNQRMRITSAGVVGIGDLNPTLASRLVVAAPSGSSNVCDIRTGTTANTNVGAIVFRNSAAAYCGQITVNGATAVTNYVSASDYRLKEDLQDFAGLDMVSKIPVYDYKWKSAESRTYGVMAHELQEVLPQAVVGEKDAEEMQGVDYSKIVPVLVKAIQELKAEIELLKAK